MQEDQGVYDQIKFEILYLNHYEHFKFETELSKVLGADHPKRVMLAKHSAETLEEVRKIAKPETKKPLRK